MADFPELDFYLARNRHRGKPLFAPLYAFDLTNWVEAQLAAAPTVDKATQMTLWSEMGREGFFASAKRGLAGYYRQNEAFPNFREPTQHTEMTLLNSLLAPLPRVNVADKLNVGTHIPAAFEGKVQSVPVARAFETPDDLDLTGLAAGAYYLKSNHGSSQGRKLMVPDDLDAAKQGELQDLARTWLDTDYGKWSSQWWYGFINRKVFLEADLTGGVVEKVADYKFHVINGRVGVLQVDGVGGRNNPIYDRDLNYLPHNFLRRNGQELPLAPGADIARDCAEAIGAGHRYLRVDFYLENGNVYLGEITVLPNAGRRNVESGELNEMLCAMWDPMPGVVRPA
ncbi:MAG: ATP-grasp fold amidoligase family protein [Pseudomonadota bacterium]